MTDHQAEKTNTQEVKSFELTDRQKIIRDAKKEDMLVSASAGTGKTTVMTERILARILQQKIKLRNILVLTFTKAASLDMKRKISDSLDQAIEAYPQKRDLLLEQRRQLQQAQISTLHAFCLRVIREFKHLLQDGDRSLVSANFTLLDEDRADELLEEAIEDVLRTTYLAIDQTSTFGKRGTREGLWLLIDVLGSGRDDRSLKEALKDFHSKLHAYPHVYEVIENAVQDATEIANNLWSKGLATWVLEDLEPEITITRWALPELKSWLPSVMIVQNPKTNEVRHQQVERIFELAEELIKRYDHLANWVQGKTSYNAQIDDWDQWRQNIDQFVAAKKAIRLSRGGNDADKEAFVNFYNISVKALCLRFTEDGKGKTILFRRPQAEVQEELQAMLPAINSFAELLSQVKKHYDEKKRRMGVVDFADLEHFALQILENPEAQNYYQKRFSEIYVDEYQDTSEIQEAILNQLGPGKTFRVGDVKQSIYRFRQAEPKLFLKRLHAYQREDGGKLYTLSENFRSTPKILALVNQIFVNLMKEEVAEIEYAGLHELIPGKKKDTGDDEPCMFLSLTLIDKKYNEDDHLTTNDEDEASDLLLIQDLKTLKEEKEKEGEKVSWGDFCVMARARASLKRLMPLLERAEIPYCYTEAAEDEMIPTEQRKLEALIQVLDNPRQDYPLAGILLSPFVPEPWTEKELLQLRLSKKDNEMTFHEIVLDAELEDASFQSKLDSFRLWLTDLRRPLGEGGLIQRFAELFQSSGFYQLCALQSQTDVQEFPETFLCYLENHPDLQSFRDLAKLLEDDKHLELSEAQERDTGVLQLMTIHGTKGLEFPYVFLMDAKKDLLRRYGTPPLHYEKDLGFTLKYMDAQKPVRRDNLLDQLIKSKDYREELAEETRLFYVALTRAEKKIFIYAKVDSGKFREKQEERDNWFQAQTYYGIDGSELHHFYQLEKIRSSRSYLDFLSLALTEQSRERLSPVLLDTHKESVELDLSDLVRLRLTPVFIPLEEAPNMSPFRGTKIVEMGPLMGPRSQVKEENPLIKDIAEKSFFLQQGEGEIDPWYQALFAEERRDKFSENIDLKYSVSELQRQAEERYEMEERVVWQAINRQQHKLSDVNLDGREPSRLRGAERGSAIHKVLRYMDWKALREAWEVEGLPAGIAAYQKQLSLMLEAKMIEPIVYETAKPLAPQMIQLVAHEIGYKIANRKVLQEQPFTLRISTDELYPEANTELHIQGVLDLAWFEEDGAGLLDFKTDHLYGTKDEMRVELKRRYSRQLNYYALALERSGLTDRVKTKVIFLVDQGELFFF